MSIRCEHNTEYSQFTTLAVVMTCVVPFGVPLVLALYFIDAYRMHMLLYLSGELGSTIQDQVTHSGSQSEAWLSYELPMLLGGAALGTWLSLWHGAAWWFILLGTVSGAAVSYAFVRYTDVGEVTEASLQENKERLCLTFKGLVHDYKPRFFFFELIDWTRKAMLSAGLLVFDHGSTEQLFTGLVLSFFFFALTVATQPFVRTTHNLLKGMEESAIFLTFAVSLLLKTQPDMKPSRERNYDILLTSSVAVLFGGVALQTVLTVRSLIKQKKMVLLVESDVRGHWGSGALAGMMQENSGIEDGHGSSMTVATSKPAHGGGRGSAISSSVLRAAALMAVASVVLSAAATASPSRLPDDKFAEMILPVSDIDSRRRRLLFTGAAQRHTQQQGRTAGRQGDRGRQHRHRGSSSTHRQAPAPHSSDRAYSRGTQAQGEQAERTRTNAYTDLANRSAISPC